MNKVPVLVGSAPGFVLNRLGSAWYAAAGYMLVHGGASVRRIDSLSSQRLGFVAGPFSILDSITLATAKRVGACILDMLGADREKDGRALHAMVDAMLSRGWVGRAHRGESRGFYCWKDGHQQEVNAEVRRGDSAQR